MSEDYFKDDDNDGGGKSGLNPVVIAVVVIVVVVGLIISFGQRQKFTPVTAGTVAIDFELPDLDGKLHKLSDYRGKVIFLNFWATWCGPCEEEMPSMQQVYDILKKAPFEMIAISLDKGSADTIREFRDKHKLSFLILHDKKNKYKELYKATGVPETFIIDQNGVIAEKIWGPRDWSRQENIATILRLLKEGPAAPESYARKR
jgi:peroxiredoxin